MIKRLAAALAALACIPAAAQAAVDGFEVGNWLGSAYYDDASGDFLYCAMDAPYQSGHSLIFAITAEGTFAIALLHEDWRLDGNASYPVEIWIDDIDLGEHWGETVSEQMIWIPLDYTTALIDRIRRGNEISVVTRQETFYFALTSTYEALPRLQQCAESSLAATYEKSNPFAGIETQRQNPFDAGDERSSGEAAPEISSAEEIETIKSLLFLAGLENYTYIEPTARADLFFYDADHVWSDGVTEGALYIYVDTTGLTVDDAIASFFRIMGESCDGAFSYGVQETEIVPGFAAKRGIGRCQWPDGAVILPAIAWRDGEEIDIIAHASDETVVDGAAAADERWFEIVKLIYEE